MTKSRKLIYNLDNQRGKIMFKKLMNFTRSDLNMYMTDCHGEDGAEWPGKEDLVSDILSFGYAQECIGYLT